MDVTQLKRIMKPSAKKSKVVYLVSYLENEDSVTITYRFKNQKDSHLKVPENIWNGMTFKKEGKDILISDLNGLIVKTNENGWSRLVVESEEEEQDE